MTRRIYLIYTWTYDDAKRVARSFGLSPTKWRWIGPKVDKDMIFNLPKGYRPKGVTVLQNERKIGETLEQKDREWDEWVISVYKRLGGKK